MPRTPKPSPADKNVDADGAEMSTIAFSPGNLQPKDFSPTETAPTEVS